MEQCIHLDLTSDDGEWDPVVVQQLEYSNSNTSSIHIPFEDMIKTKYCHMDALSNMMSKVHVNSLSHTTKLELTQNYYQRNGV